MITWLWCVGVLLCCVTVASGWSSADCPPRPLCESANASFKQLMWCRMGRDPIGRHTPEYLQVVRERLAYFMSRSLLGQDHLVPKILADVHHKLRRPNEPLILHFAGDNGVGKTSAAQLISAALSFRCHASNIGYYCGLGEDALSLSGTNYHGMSIDEFRKSIVPQVLAFAKGHPHGLVILNDLTELDPQHVGVLMPLLGRSHHFPEDLRAEHDLHKLMVVVTTDFGKQGRTRGKDFHELQQMVEEEVRGTFGALAGSYLRTYAFIPATLPAARGIARLALHDWACAEHMHSLTVDDEAIDAAVDGCIGQVAFENGRAVVKHMETVLGMFHLEGGALRGRNVTVRGRNGILEMHVDEDAHLPAEL